MAVDLLTNLLRVGIKDPHHLKPAPPESAVSQHRSAKLADADQDHFLDPAVEPQDAAQSFPQTQNLVAPAALAEPAKVGQILANLRGRHAQPATELLGRDEISAFARQQP